MFRATKINQSILSRTSRIIRFNTITMKRFEHNNEYNKKTINEKNTDINQDMKNVNQDMKNVNHDMKDINQDMKNVNHDMKDINHDNINNLYTLIHYHPFLTFFVVLVLTSCISDIVNYLSGHENTPFTGIRIRMGGQDDDVEI